MMITIQLYSSDAHKSTLWKTRQNHTMLAKRQKPIAKRQLRRLKQKTNAKNRLIDKELNRKVNLCTRKTHVRRYRRLRESFENGNFANCTATHLFSGSTSSAASSLTRSSISSSSSAMSLSSTVSTARVVRAFSAEKSRAIPCDSTSAILDIATLSFENTKIYSICGFNDHLFRSLPLSVGAKKVCRTCCQSAKTNDGN